MCFTSGFLKIKVMEWIWQFLLVYGLGTVFEWFLNRVLRKWAKSDDKIDWKDHVYDLVKTAYDIFRRKNNKK